MAKEQSFIIDNQSPYFLHPSDSPGAIITAIRFDGKNYELWESAVRTSLRSKNKLGFIDGTITKPTVQDGKTAAEINAWEMVNSMVQSWIMNIIDPKLHKSVAYVNSAQSLWENIRKRYAVANIPKIHTLKAEIASCKQNKQEVVEFFSRLMGLWNELDNYVKIPSCTCGSAKQIVQIMENDKAHQFLMGLDDES